MPSVKNSCCKDFKAFSKGLIGHIKCTNDQAGGLVSGRRLNVLLNVGADSKDHMNTSKSYFVCRRILRKANLIKAQDTRLKRKCVFVEPRPKSRRIEILNPNRKLFQQSDVENLRTFSIYCGG